MIDRSICRNEVRINMGDYKIEFLFLLSMHLLNCAHRTISEWEMKTRYHLRNMALRAVGTSSYYFPARLDKFYIFITRAFHRIVCFYFNCFYRGRESILSVQLWKNDASILKILFSAFHNFIHYNRGSKITVCD
jgi:hypothetical protein